MKKAFDPDDLPFFLGLMEHLAAHNIPGPIPLRARAGRNLCRKLTENPARSH